MTDCFGVENVILIPMFINANVISDSVSVVVVVVLLLYSVSYTTLSNGGSNSIDSVISEKRIDEK